MIACYSFGSRKWRDIDILHWYGNSFKEGSTRRKVYDNAVRKAMRTERLPSLARDVLVEIRAELRTYIWETSMQKMTRLDIEFEALEQGGMSHADFRALFEGKLQDMEESQMDMPTAQTLYRRYMQKLSPELRHGVQSKEWKIDGEDHPPRRPVTHRDIARAVGLYQEEKADILATGTRSDTLMLVEHRPQPQLRQGGQSGGGAKQCGYCHRADHPLVACPQKAADTRNHSASCLADFSARGKVCATCQQPGHEGKHHLFAVQDYAATQKQGAGVSSGPVRKTPPPPQPRSAEQERVPDGQTKCKYGDRCWAGKKEGKCPNWHPRAEWKELLREYQAKRLSEKATG